MVRRWKVALIESDPWSVEGLRLFFRCLGCDLRVFRTPTEALQELSAEGADVIVCDYWLPERDGLSLLAALKKRHPAAICLLTAAYLLPGVRTEAEELGIHGLVRKPLTASNLLTALGEVFHVKSTM